MTPMTYDDVKGQLPRYWKMHGTPDPRLGLMDGDYLVFEGNAPGTIAKIRPKMRGSLRNLPDPWGAGFTATSRPGSQYTIEGTLVSDPAVKIKIKFTAADGTTGAKLDLSAEFPEDILPISWQAEEGP